MVKTLARFFCGLNMAMGVTTLPENAGPEQERTFVYIWLAIAAFFMICIVILFFWITS